MPYKPKKSCGYPGCPELVPVGERLCLKHKREEQRRYNQQRGTRQQQAYDKHWLKLRKVKLNHDPLCEECLREGRTTPATQVDHIDGNVRNNRFDNLQSLCHSCHSRKTAKENKRWG